MINILITEFMDEESIKTLKKNFNVKYDKDLFQNEKKIKEEISNFEAIIVRNKTQLQKTVFEESFRIFYCQYICWRQRKNILAQVKYRDTIEVFS